MTGLHTVLTTELLRSDISFGLVLFPKGYNNRSVINMPILDSNAKGITCEALSVLGQTMVTDQTPMNRKFVYIDQDSFSHIPINCKCCIINPSINSPTPNRNR